MDQGSTTDPVSTPQPHPQQALPGFYTTLLHTAASPQAPRDVRQAAGIALKVSRQSIVGGWVGGWV